MTPIIVISNLHASFCCCCWCWFCLFSNFSTIIIKIFRIFSILTQNYCIIIFLRSPGSDLDRVPHKKLWYEWKPCWVVCILNINFNEKTVEIPYHFVVWISHSFRLCFILSNGSLTIHSIHRIMKSLPKTYSVPTTPLSTVKIQCVELLTLFNHHHRHANNIFKD